MNTSFGGINPIAAGIQQAIGIGTSAYAIQLGQQLNSAIGSLQQLGQFAFGHLAAGAIQQVVGNIFNQQAGEIFGQAFLNAFGQAIGLDMGQLGFGSNNTTPDNASILDQIKDLLTQIADNQGAPSSPASSYTGDLSRAVNDLNTTMEELMEQLAMNGIANESDEDGSGSGKAKSKGGGNWLEAIAKALGEMMGEKATKMMDAVHDMQDNMGEDDSKEFMEAQTRFQVESQLFSMISQQASTAIKAVGEGLASVSRKQ